MKNKLNTSVYRITAMALSLPDFQRYYFNLDIDTHSPFPNISDLRWMSIRLKHLRRVAAYARRKNPAVYPRVLNYIQRLECYQRRARRKWG